MEIVVGTAGHIDHGKTALVRALTGVDTDRLPEERKRGITIDLGFADLTVGDTCFGFVDVPGHERFVKNMLAGATGIDLVLLVVAADEGVMPQTLEHFDICRLLGVTSGLVAITKTDIVDQETFEIVRLQVMDLVNGTFLDGAPMIGVSVKDGSGLGLIKEALGLSAASIRRPEDISIARLPLDRSFTVKGFGTVVTGTLSAGKITTGDELEILPDGRRVRIRGLQMHGKQTVSAVRGSRVAVNLANVSLDGLERGMTLCEPGSLKPSQIIDTRIEVLSNAAALRTHQRVRVNIGTAEILARLSVINEAGRIEPGTTDFAQIRLETPAVSLPGERFIIRSYSPSATIAGGIVIVNSASKFRKRESPATRQHLEQLSQLLEMPDRYAVSLVEFAGERGLNFADLQARTGIHGQKLTEILHAAVAAGSIIDCGEHYVGAGIFAGLKSQTVKTIEAFHEREPLAKGMSLDVLRDRAFPRVRPPVSRFVIERLVEDGAAVVAGDMLRLTSHKNEMSSQEAAVADELLSIYRTAGSAVPRTDDALRQASTAAGIDGRQTLKVFRLLVDNGDLVRVSDEFAFSSDTIESITRSLRKRGESSGDPMIDVAGFKGIAGVSRKYAIPLLEYFDRVGVTRRAGDKRVIIR